MIYGSLNVFQIYSALITARSTSEFAKLFCDVVKDAVEQYELFFALSLEPERKQRIHNELENLLSKDIESIDSLFYDMTIDGFGYHGIVEVAEVFYNKQDVIEKYQSWADELNEDVDEPEEQWAVFGGGFFPENPGYDIDDLFK